MLRRHLGVCLTALALLVAGVVRPALAATTKCSFGGPAPGFKAVRLDLPSGSSFLNIEILGTHDVHVLNTGDGWHLAQGVILVRTIDRGIVASRLRSAGSSPPGAVVRAGGADTGPLDGVPAPDVAFTHSFGPGVPQLDPGSYFAIAWGAGGRGLSGPADTWGASVEVEGAHPCASIGAGEVFDHDQNDFTGGTQVTAPGVAVMDGASLEVRSSPRSFVAGMIDANVQGAGTGEARVDYTMPAGGAGTVDREVKPFTGGAGTSVFTAHVTGLFPVVAVNGVRIDLP
jgi:hypothetical protein